MNLDPSLLEQLDAKRIKAVRYLSLAAVFFVFGFLSFFVTFFRFYPFLIIIMIGAVIFFIIGTSHRNQYQSEVKEKILKAYFASRFEDIQYEPDHGFSRDYIRSTELVSMGNRFYSNDLLKGKAKGISFKRSDVLIQEHTQHEKHSTTITLYQGEWMVFTFPKPFNGILQIRDNEGRVFKNRKPFFWFSDLPKTDVLKFENPEFNQRYTIYASDPQEAYYLITPHLMDKITKLDDRLDCPILLGFINQEFHVALDSRRDAFKIGLKPISQQFLAQIEQDCQIIEEIVEGLNL